MYKSNESAPPGAQVARYREQVDPNDVVQTGERVPYIVIHKQETSRLRDTSHRPEVVLFPSTQNGAPQICAPYYIMKRILPALNRVFSLIGVDVFQWYRTAPRSRRTCPTAACRTSGSVVQAAPAVAAVPAVPSPPSPRGRARM